MQVKLNQKLDAARAELKVAEQDLRDFVARVDMGPGVEPEKPDDRLEWNALVRAIERAVNRLRTLEECQVVMGEARWAATKIAILWVTASFLVQLGLIVLVHMNGGGS